MSDPDDTPYENEKIAQNDCANTPTEITILKQITKTKSCCVNLVGDEGKGERMAQELCAIYAGKGMEIIDFLVEYWATSVLEMVELYCINERTVTEVFQRLRGLDLMSMGPKLDDNRINKEKPGPKPRIFHLKCATEHHIKKAWLRWVELHRVSSDIGTVFQVESPLLEEHENIAMELLHYYQERKRRGFDVPFGIRPIIDRIQEIYVDVPGNFRPDIAKQVLKLLKEATNNKIHA